MTVRSATPLFDQDAAVREHAAREWCAWEDTHISLAPGHTPSERYEDPESRLRLARLVTHYWRHAAFLPDGQLLRHAGTLNGIPGILIRGGRALGDQPVRHAVCVMARWI